MGAGGIAVVVCTLLPIAEALGVLPEFPIGKREMKTRAEYYTESGKYRGGNPSFSGEFQVYECTRFDSVSSSAASSDDSATTTSTTNTTATDGSTTSTTDGGNEENAAVCMGWTVHKLESDVHDVGRCLCQSIANTGYYCDAWTCSHLGAESARCTCQTEDADSGQFCSSWTCLKTDSDGERIGDYLCVTVSSAPTFCESWTGIVEGSEVVEVASCACAEQLDGVGVCSHWECKVRGLSKCSRSVFGTCDIGVSVGVGGFVGSLGAMLVALGVYNLNKPRRWRYGMYADCNTVGFRITAGLLWMAVSSVGVVLWGGQDGAMYAGIWWGTIIALGLLCRCLPTFRGCIMPRYVACRARYIDRKTNRGKTLDQPIPN